MAQKEYDIRKTPTPCVYSANDGKASPHIHRPKRSPKLIYDNILEAIGNTPMVRINNMTRKENIACELLVKCEYLNPGGSVKDRIGVRMVEDAEEMGRIQPGYTLIEPTSGNTGIGLSMTAAVKGYKLLITLPEKMSKEKSDTMQSLGAQIIRTPTEAAFDAPDSHIGVAEKLERELPNAVILDQYSNPSNPLAHYDQTGVEIYDQCEGRIDYIIMSTGTGGTMTGISRKLKELIPSIVVVGVDPEGSIIADPENSQPGIYKVEGIGYDFVPRVCDTTLVDRWVVTKDQESFDMARRLIREEALLAGGSSGSVMAAAMKIAKELPAGKRVVALLPDSIRNYMTKFISDSWMIENEFLVPDEPNNPLLHKTVSDLNLQPTETLPETATCGQAIAAIENLGGKFMPVVNEDGKLKGVVSIDAAYTKLATKRINNDTPCKDFMIKSMKVVKETTSMVSLAEMLESSSYAVYEKDGQVSLITAKLLSEYSANLVG